MKKGLDEIVVVLDRSGSMSTVWDDALGGINSFIADQKAVPREAHFTLVLFDHEFITFYDRANMKHVTALTKSDYTPRGSTSLLKAVSDTVDTVGQKLSALDEAERPEKVIVAVLTDGHENNSNTGEDAIAYSREHEEAAAALDKLGKYTEASELRSKYTKDKLKAQLAHQHDVYKWEVMFLSANMDAFDEGAAMGATRSYAYTGSKIGTQSAFMSFSENTTAYRMTGNLAKSAVIDEDEINKKKAAKAKK